MFYSKSALSVGGRERGGREGEREEEEEGERGRNGGRKVRRSVLVLITLAILSGSTVVQ